MSNGTEKEAGETSRKLSRRRLLGQAALVVGGAAAAAGMTARSALARASDVSIDSSGKVSINGTILAANEPEKRRGTSKRRLDTNISGCTTVNTVAHCGGKVK